ncbi:MAG: efflux RND transporter periplasmic adaptor subunit, partial [Gammaproteobacteria bacterium]
SLDSARFEYARCPEQLATIRQNLKYATVRSPLAGVIKDRKVNPGEVVQNGDLLFTVGRIDSIYVVANVAQEKLPRVHIGQEAEIVFDSFPQQVVTGYVGKIDPSTDPKTRTFPTYIRVKNPQLRFKPGLSAYARLKYQHYSLTIPSLAVIERGGEAIVFVAKNSRVHLRPVKVQPGPLGKSEVIEGLKEGEEVVYYGLKSLKDNDTVDVGNAGGKDFEG